MAGVAGPAARAVGTTRLARVARTLALVIGLVIAAAACGSEADGVGASDVEEDGSADVRYLVPAEGSAELVVAEDPGVSYGAGFRGPDGDRYVLRVYDASIPTGRDEARAILDAAPSVLLGNGLDAALICGGASTTAAPGTPPGGRQEPSGDEPVTTSAGPLMVAWEADVRLGTLEVVPNDTGACSPPTVAEGPLVEVAGSLRWIDEAEFRRLLVQFPAPDRESTPPTTRRPG